MVSTPGTTSMSKFITFTTNLPEVDPFIVEDLDTVRSVVRDENFLAIVNHYSIGKLQMLGTTELIENIATLVKNDDSHDFALNDYDTTLVVHGYSSGMLQNVGTKFTHKLAILIVNLNLY